MPAWILTCLLVFLRIAAGSDAGLNIYVYACNTSMGHAALNNSDGDFLIGVCVCWAVSSAVAHGVRVLATYSATGGPVACAH